ncbi:hypothetical protein [Pseudomonas alabamensis]|uniref:hypothetical protein n=1 Tax=Pseudomonas alabamensis TaxID=3064349 RepID=UPI000AB2A36E
MEFQAEQLDDLSIQVLTTLYQAFPDPVRLLPAGFGLAASYDPGEELAPKYGSMPLLSTKNFLMGRGMIVMSLTANGPAHSLSGTGLYICEKIGLKRDVALSENVFS